MCEKVSQWCNYQSIVFNLKQHPVYPCFAILTAFNPRSIVISDSQNNVRHQRLISELRAVTQQLLPIICSDPSGQWQEQGVMIGIPLDVAKNYAAQWGQNAIYWVEGGSLFLVPVLLQGYEIQRLGDWRGFFYT
ncbi:DUF3293 domain-containing protein [Photobacterium makurazakiensis]|uniref:DUF3293 domain-containing protein n=1 Tax=Photobacterium makurazakiensis TaxID=2910234 RepID=UPI003D0E830A